jgi:hypothetical protein
MQEGLWEVMPRFCLIKGKAPPKVKCTHLKLLIILKEDMLERKRGIKRGWNFIPIYYYYYY